MYWVFGLDPETLPDDYVTDPAVMINFQERTYYDQVKEIDDDFVPYLMPWYGTIVTASALGCQAEGRQVRRRTAGPPRGTSSRLRVSAKPVRAALTQTHCHPPLALRLVPVGPAWPSAHLEPVYACGTLTTKPNGL